MPVNARPPVGLEQIVRPFLPSSDRPDRSRVYLKGGNNTTGETTNTEGEDIPTLKWEAIAPTQVVTLPAMGFTVDLGGDDGPDVNQLEQARTTHVERIFSDTDPDTWIDVEVIDEIEFENDSKLRRKYKLNNGG